MTKAPMISNDKEYDDLTVINGIGPVLQRWFREALKVRTYADLAALSADEIEAQLRADGKIPDRSKIDHWLERARELAAVAALAPQQAAETANTETGGRSNAPDEADEWEWLNAFIVEFRALKVEGQVKKQEIRAYPLKVSKKGDWLDNGETKKTPIVFKKGEQLFPWMLEQVGEEAWSEPEEERVTEPPLAEPPVAEAPPVPTAEPSTGPTPEPCPEPWELIYASKGEITCCAKNSNRVQRGECQYQHVIIDKSFPKGKLRITGTIIRTTKSDIQRKESAFVLCDNEKVYESWDKHPNVPEEPFGPLELSLEAGQHTVVVRHAIDDPDYRRAESVDVDLEVCFLPDEELPGGHWCVRGHLQSLVGPGQDYLLPPSGGFRVLLTEEIEKPEAFTVQITEVSIQQGGGVAPSNVFAVDQDWSIHFEWKLSGSPEGELLTYDYAHDINIAAGDAAAGEYKLWVTVIYETEAGRSIGNLAALGDYGPELTLQNK